MSRPFPPFNVVAIPYNASATVYWNAPTNDGGGAIYQYTVISIPDNQMVITPGVTITNIFGLTNGTSYQFGVIATNQYGDSDMSVFSLPITPLEKTLPQPPQNPVAHTRPEAIYLTWNSPTNNGGENITGYTITLLETGQHVVYPVFEDNPDPNYPYNHGYLWKNLVNNYSYSFSISCFTVLGNSIDAFFNSAIPSPVPLPPTGVYLETNFNDLTSATVYWTPPVMDPIMTGITNYVIISEPPYSNSPMTVGPSNTSWVMVGLNPSVSYYFYVYAVNEAGNSNLSNPAGPNQILSNRTPVIYKPLVTGGNDPSISQKMRYAYGIGRLRKSQYVNYGGGAAFYT